VGTKLSAVRPLPFHPPSEVVEPTPTPFLKWAGGKGQLLEQMAPYLPAPGTFGTYFEPFVGGGALFFHLHPKHAILSDLNAELIHVYQMVRDQPEALMRALDAHFNHRLNEEYFYSVRRQRPEGLTLAARAARTVFLNKTCFNGLYRVNSKGEFNVPFGGYRNPTLYVRENILAVSAALENTELLVADYQDACNKARKGDFVYFDPPYDPLSKTSAFTSYTSEGFGERQQRELAALFRTLDRKGCKVLLSNSATPLLDELYREYAPIRLKAKRAINCKGNGRGVIDELLIMNYP